MRDTPLDPNRCCEMVTPSGTWAMASRYQCSHKWKVERDGKRYCNQHDPEKVKARSDARLAVACAKYDARNNAFRADRRIHDLHPKLLALARQGYELASVSRAIEHAIAYQQAYNALGLTEQEKEQT